MAEPAAVRIDDLRFAYGDDFLLELRQLMLGAGDRAVCVGPSGCGKTTLLHLIAGILTPASGRIAVGGTDLGGLDDAGRRRFRISRIGMIFQEFELLEHLPVRDNVLLPYFIQPALKLDADALERLQRLAGATGLTGKLRRLPRTLSQGERQRVAICRALVTEPGLVLADEPTGNLDPAATESVLALLLDAVERRGASLLMVTHDHGLLPAFDRVIDLSGNGVGAT